jgi:hypothetical protein
LAASQRAQWWLNPREFELHVLIGQVFIAQKFGARPSWGVTLAFMHCDSTRLVKLGIGLANLEDMKELDEIRKPKVSIFGVVLLGSKTSTNDSGPL